VCDRLVRIFALQLRSRLEQAQLGVRSVSITAGLRRSDRVRVSGPAAYARPQPDRGPVYALGKFLTEVPAALSRRSPRSTLAWSGVGSAAGSGANGDPRLGAGRVHRPLPRRRRPGTGAHLLKGLTTRLRNASGSTPSVTYAAVSAAHGHDQASASMISSAALTCSARVRRGATRELWAVETSAGTWSRSAARCPAGPGCPARTSREHPRTDVLRGRAAIASVPVIAATRITALLDTARRGPAAAHVTARNHGGR